MSKPSLSAMLARLEQAKQAGPKSKASALQGPSEGVGSSSADVTVVNGSTAPPQAVVATPAAGNPSLKPAVGDSTQTEAQQQAKQTELRARARRLMVRTFVRSMLKPGSGFMNARVAYNAIHPDTAENTARNQGYLMLGEEDVKDEMTRQLRAIDKAADMDDQWVYDRWRAIANANLFDYCTVGPDGKLVFDKLDPQHLTIEQQLVIREIQIDPKTGFVRRIKLASIDQAVANVARARQMIDGKRDLGAVDLAARITERMQKAAARIGRTFDGDTGEQIA